MAVKSSSQGSVTGRADRRRSRPLASSEREVSGEAAAGVPGEPSGQPGADAGEPEDTGEPEAGAEVGEEPGRSPSLVSQTGTAVGGVTARIGRALLRRVGGDDIAIELWDGTKIAVTESPRFLARIHDRATLARMLADPQYQVPEAYADGRLTIEGDLTEMLTSAFERMGETPPWADRFTAVQQRLTWPLRNSLHAACSNAQHHYDIGNDFYRLWLDEQLVYTCAYFPDTTLTLEEAQRAKLDLVSRKLRLRPGEQVIEAGCGWGALAIHMASHYGVSVTAYNVSAEQVAYARERVRRLGLSHRVTFVQEDWRNIRGECDAFVSVGMLEHVGTGNYRRLGGVIRDCLRPSGRGLIHAIGVKRPRPLNRWIERNIFPGAAPPALSQMAELFEPYDFAVADVENLRPHYAETLRHWLSRFEQAADLVGEQFDERFVRMWRMYLACSIAAFETGALQLFQVLFAPPQSHCLPWTRSDLYRTNGAAVGPVAPQRSSDSSAAGKRGGHAPL